jgi:superfamily II DNA or RNA helicase
VQIVENKILLFRTQHPQRYSIIPKHKAFPIPGGYEIAVYWGLDEARVLRNLGVRNVPSPIYGRYDWPGRFKPMAHQQETASFLTLNRRAFVLSEPGTGKTLSALWAADYLMTRGDVRRVLILCPMSIMHSAWMQDIGNSVIHRSAIVAHHAQASRRIEAVQEGHDIVITNYEGLDLISTEVKNDGRFDLVIVDECFVAGTLVGTPLGRHSIEQLQPGDKVLTSNGVARIKRLVRNTATRLVEVRLGNEKTLRCTPEHPFFTDAGWVCAKNLTGRRLISGVELSYLRAGIPPYAAPGTLGYGKEPPAWPDLLEILRAEEVSLSESGGQLLQQNAARATGQVYRPENSGASGETVGGTEGAMAQTESTGRQRQGHDACRTTDFRGLACGVGMELPNSVGWEATRLSYELQARLRVARPDGGVGSGRQQPYGENTARAGSQEGRETGDAWVESVSYIECPSGVDVFNLEVEGAPNYLVGDHWVVHNCNAYKNPQTKRWKVLNSLLTSNTYLWMMTGTPAAQSPVDAYGLAKLVNPKGVPAFQTAWRDTVMNKVTMFKWAPKADAADRVHRALQPAIRYTKEQCLDLPPVVTMTREVPLTPQQAKYYNALKTAMVAQAAGETITAVNAAAALNKLLQISCGVAYSDNGETVEFDATPRLNVLLEVLEETDRKVIVFALFRAAIETISVFLNKRGVACEEIHGGVTATKRGDIIKRFQTLPDPRVLVMQPQAAAHGITLTAADTVVFFGPLMSVEQYVQACARADRKGQTSDKVTVVHIQGSPVEKKMFAALAGKVDDNRLLVDLFKSEIAERGLTAKK